MSKAARWKAGWRGRRRRSPAGQGSPEPPGVLAARAGGSGPAADLERLVTSAPRVDGQPSRHPSTDLGRSRHVKVPTPRVTRTERPWPGAPRVAPCARDATTGCAGVGTPAHQRLGWWGCLPLRPGGVGGARFRPRHPGWAGPRTRRPVASREPDAAPPIGLRSTRPGSFHPAGDARRPPRGGHPASDEGSAWAGAHDRAGRRRDPSAAPVPSGACRCAAVPACDDAGGGVIIGRRRGIPPGLRQPPTHGRLGCGTC